MNGRISVDELISSYADSLWKKGAHRESALLYLNEIAGIKTGRFDRIEEKDYLHIADELLKRRNKNSTVNRKISAFTKLLRQAQLDHLIPNVPVFRRLKENADQLRFLSLLEEKHLLAALRRRDPLYANITVFLLDTGMTIGEAVELRWHDICKGTVNLPESTKGLARQLPLTDRCRQIIKGRECGSGPFAKIEQAKFRTQWNEAKAEIGLSKDRSVVPTILRHTCASRLVLSGIDLRRVQRWLGNHNYKSMVRYERLCQSDDFELCAIALEKFTANTAAQERGTGFVNHSLYQSGEVGEAD